MAMNSTIAKPRKPSMNKPKPVMQKPKKTPEQIKAEKIQKIKQQIADLRKKKAELRGQSRLQGKIDDFARKAEEIDAKINDKLAKMRDVATGAAQKVGHAVKRTAELPKRAWDNWRV